MLDESPKRFPIRCRWCADHLLIEVAIEVKALVGYAECSRAHVTRYRYDGVTVFTEERGQIPPPSGPLGRLLARS